MEIYLDRAPEPGSFTKTVAQVQAYVRGEHSAYAAIITAADEDPTGTATNLLTLGTVLLDIAAGAFSLTPDEMLAKVSLSISEHADTSG